MQEIAQVILKLLLDCLMVCLRICHCSETLVLASLELQ